MVQVYFDDVILHLGGRFDRVYHTLEMAKANPRALVIISSEVNPVAIRQMWQAAGLKNIMFDYRCWDTVSQFTMFAGLFRRMRVKRLHVVTDQFHIERAMAIGRTVFEGEAMQVLDARSHTVEEGRVEPRSQIRKDVLRAVVWYYMGILFYNPLIKRRRMPGIRASGATLNGPVA